MQKCFNVSIDHAQTTPTPPGLVAFLGQTLEQLKVVDDIIVMLRSDWPASERAISRAGWPVYEVRFTGVGMH